MLSFESEYCTFKKILFNFLKPQLVFSIPVSVLVHHLQLLQVRTPKSQVHFHEKMFEEGIPDLKGNAMIALVISTEIEIVISTEMSVIKLHHIRVYPVYMSVPQPNE